MKMGKKKDEKTGTKGEETQQKATYLKEEIKKSSMHAKDSRSEERRVGKEC